MNVKNWVPISIIIAVVGGLMLLFNAEWGKTAAQQNWMTWVGGTICVLFLIMAGVGYAGQGRKK